MNLSDAILIYTKKSMCGIAGLASNQEIRNELTSDILKEMSELLAHRGPDDTATYLSPRCGMMIRRLSILDLTPGLYPFYSEDKSKVLVFNGEIYNYPELKKELQDLGCEFKTGCDAEAILLGYEKFGNNIFEKLQGMFAISIWDDKEQKLTLVRDRIGIKPLYYYQENEQIYFASEAKAIIKSKSLGKNFTIDKHMAELLIGFMYLPESDSTIINGIKKLPPASILEFQGGHVKITKFWELTVNNAYADLSFEDAKNQLEALLIDTVKKHMLSDVEVGVMLSGGVDSGLLTAILTKELGYKDIHTFTGAFDSKYNESDLANETSHYLGTNHHELKVDLTQTAQNIEDLITSFDDLTTFDAGLITTKLISKKIKELGYKVVLLGEGADEIFGGYSWFGLSQIPYKYAPKYLVNFAYYYATTRNLFYKPFKYVNYITSKNILTNSFESISNYETSVQLPNHLLMKVDKGSMAGSVEARVPYLDHKLVEFVYSLNPSFKLKGIEKYILREIAKKYLPEETAVRKKKGFLFPMGEFLTANQEMVKSYVLDQNSYSGNFLTSTQKTDLFNKSGNNLLNMHREYLLWKLFVLDVWTKVYNL